MLIPRPIDFEKIGFFHYVFKKKENLSYLILAIIVSTIVWLVFKYYYPNPNIIFDSYHYMNATVANSYVNAWPIGYSWFIRFVGNFSRSANFLLSFQYVLLNFSLIFIFFTIRYFFCPARWVSLLLITFFLFNPIFYYTSNLILSDTLFTALSILWVTNLIWILVRPKYWMIITNALLLVAAFSIRYNALYYPVVATIAFLLAKRNILFKSLGIALQLSVIAAFVIFTIVKMDAAWGVKQFSPFGGWKLANDALYMYKYIYNRSNHSIPGNLMPLDQHVKRYFDTNKDTIDLFTPDVTSGSYYMYIHPSPLLTYRDRIFGLDDSSLDLKKFAKMGPLYQDYGAWVIKNNSIAFVKYFIWPNIQRYFIAPPEVYTDNFNPFSLRTDSLGLATRNWFNLKSITSKQSVINFRHNIFMNYPILNVIIHILFVFTFLSLFFTGSLYKLHPLLIAVVIVIAILWLFDFLFNISAAAVVLRYQIFISVIEFSFSAIFLSQILNEK